MTLALALGPEYLKIGLLNGLTYAVLAAGLVLVYRATRIINFAHAQIGAFAAAALAKLVLDAHWNFWITSVLMVGLGAAIGAVIELTVIRRLSRSPRVILLVATIGVAQLLLLLQVVLTRTDNLGERYPTGIGGAISVGNVVLRGEDLMVLAVAPALVLGLGLLLSRSRWGLDVRAVADNPDAARLASVPAHRISTTVWMVAGALSTAMAILIGPSRPVNLPPQALDPSLMLKALCAALVGRFISLPLSLAGGLGVGVAEAMVRANLTDPQVVDVVLFGAVLMLVLGWGRRVSETPGAHFLTPPERRVPSRLAHLASVRRLPLMTAAAGTCAGLVLPLVVTAPVRLFLFTEMLIYALLALSVTVLTGWGGQLSLGQFGFVAVGAAGTSALTYHGVPFVSALAISAAAGALVAVVVGLPALRLRGLLLSIITLGFGTAAFGLTGLLLGHQVLSDGTVMRVARPALGPLDLAVDRNYYYLCLTVLVVAAVSLARLRRSGIGRSLIAVRDNDLNAAAFTISPASARLTAFALSGALAALAGALLGGLDVTSGTELVSVDQSVRAVAIAVIGGLGSVAGSVLGAMYVLGLPALFDNAFEASLATGGAGLLLVLMYLPRGIVGAVQDLRDLLLGLLERRAAPAPRRAAVDAGGHAPCQPAACSAGPARSGPALAASDLTVRLSGRTVLDHAGLTVEDGEVVGLIGGNGAGKTTLMNAISGVVPATGEIRLRGRELSGLAVHRRARRGLGRGFQSARLFPGLTVLECVQVALEARRRSELVPTLLALPPSRRLERTRAEEATELISFLGLGRHADVVVSDLSTGTRRITEMACLLALGSRLLLLDEPAAGIAQREVEAFGPLLLSLRTELGASLLVIEHDIPLLVSVSDRVYCLADGRMIAEGRPEDVRRDPAVIASYLGREQRSIQRSGRTA